MTIHAITYQKQEQKDTFREKQDVPRGLSIILCCSTVRAILEGMSSGG